VKAKIIHLTMVLALVALVVAILLSGGLRTAQASPAVTQVQIDQAIDNGLLWLRATQNVDGSWGWGVGETSFAVQAFLNEGIPETDPDVAEGIAFILGQRNADGSFGGNPYYETALAMMALVATANQAEYGDEVTAGAYWLLSIQNLNPSAAGYGGWGYSNTGWTDQSSDNSVNQFNTLGLHSAEMWEYEVPADRWALCVDWVSGTQNLDGGFHYGRWSGDSYGSMTGGALISLLLAGVDPSDSRIVDGFHWLGDNWTVTENPGGGRWGPGSPEWHYYYLYSVMKACEFAADKVTISNTAETVAYDWYRDDEPYGMADYLVNHQQANGSWVSAVSDYSVAMTTAEAVLVLQCTVFSYEVLSGETPTGSNVTVTPGDAIITFSNVSVAGTTTYIASTGNPGGELPADFRLRGLFVDITTTATYSGTVTVGISYDESQVSNEAKLKLFHWDGTKWKDVTTSVDTVNNIVYGQVTTLSPFFMGEPAGAEVTPTPTGNETGCFIATAAYGSYLDSHVQTLRDFRDSYMVTNPVGRSLVSAYYKLSPPVAEFIDDHPSLKPIVRAGLMPAVVMSTMAVSTTPAEKIAIALVILTLLFVMRERKGQRKAT